MNLYTIDTGFFKLDGGAMFGVVPKSLWEQFHPADENNLCTGPCGACWWRRKAA
jgi:hypothetical protein